MRGPIANAVPGIRPSAPVRGNLSRIGCCGCVARRKSIRERFREWRGKHQEPNCRQTRGGPEINPGNQSGRDFTVLSNQAAFLLRFDGVVPLENAHAASYGATPIGFIDDDRKKVGQKIHGLPVLGTRRDIGKIIKQQQPPEILIAAPSESPGPLRKIAASLQPFKILIKTLPSIRDLVQGKVTVSEIRPLTIEDLLARAPLGLDLTPIRALIAGKRIMVTGAGGSIGSELCRQIGSFGSASLALVERYENCLHWISVELADNGHGDIVHSYLADITDRPRLSQVFAKTRPHIVFHAAAHKHVPMVEMNPSEGFKNNVVGTQILADEAVCAGVERFVLISTDKAVNPTNVMGATKCAAEFCLRAMASEMNPGAATAFSARCALETSWGRTAASSRVSWSRSRPAGRSRSHTRRSGAFSC